MENTKDKEVCTCDQSSNWDEHTCPYKVEINDDSETLCTCCEHCIGVCSDEI